MLEETPAQESTTDLIWQRTLVAAQAALEKKADAPVVLDLRNHTQIADYFLILSGRSDTQTRAIADGVGEELRHQGIYPLSIEGMERGQWILIDYGDLIVHVFYAPTRKVYALESIWARASKRDLPSGMVLPAENRAQPGFVPET